MYLTGLKVHLIKTKARQTKMWCVKAYNIFCSRRKEYLHDLQKEKAAMVNDAMKYVRPPEVTKSFSSHHQLTNEYVSHFLCLFWSILFNGTKKRN